MTKQNTDVGREPPAGLLEEVALATERITEPKIDMDAARDLEGQASPPREPWSEAASNVDAVESATGRSRHA